jgi:sulfite reductase (ferredoxin)
MSTTIDESALTDVERIKAESLGLRGTLAAELVDTSSATVTHDAERILKFHGSYAQEDRDQRRERKKAGLEPAYNFMIRSKIPGGALTAQQYLVHDELTDRYADGTLRITTRQGFQFHGIMKGNLRASIHALNEALVTTFGACGDVVRNVMTCPAPLPGSVRAEVLQWAQRVSNETLPATRAYHEIWVEGTAVTVEAAEPDALYGERYMPRKFKIAFAFPDDNCTDILTNDLGFLVIADGDKLRGFNVLVGGGLGQTHGKSETFPRLADPLGFVTTDDLLAVTRAVVAVQRDYGNRVNRKRARMKYLIEERGLPWFRSEVERHLGKPLAQPLDVSVSAIQDHLGWHDQGDGRWFRGVWVENGRIKDAGDLRLRTALRTIVQRFRPDVRLTAQHNVLLTNLAPEHRADVDSILKEHGVKAIEELTPARRFEMACPALPTCGLAVSEAERVFPVVIDQLEALLHELEIDTTEITARMTGCPNGCARPYTADLAFVGRSLGKYVVYIGGNMEGTRLATIYADLITLDQLIPTVRPLFERFKAEKSADERFGDFWTRVGLVPLPSAAKLSA